MAEDRPAWDTDLANSLLGASVLIGLTKVGDEGIEQEQMFGTVVQATPNGVEVHLEGTRLGETYWLPPDPRAFVPAPKGEYRLRSTGEVVIDPDFTTSWTTQRPH